MPVTLPYFLHTDTAILPRAHLGGPYACRPPPAPLPPVEVGGEKIVVIFNVKELVLQF